MSEILLSTHQTTETQLDPGTVDTVEEEAILDRTQIADVRETIEDIHDDTEDEAAKQAAAAAKPAPLAPGPTKIIIRK